MNGHPSSKWVPVSFLSRPIPRGGVKRTESQDVQISIRVEVAKVVRVKAHKRVRNGKVEKVRAHYRRY